MGVRISGVDIPRSKRGVIGLTYLYGIGRSMSKIILDSVGINENKKVENWSDDDISKIRKYISNNIKIEGELRSDTQLNIKRLMDIGCYIGTRHRKGLPLRGQKTKNNCRTRKGRKKTVANKKKVTK
ncbi:30S ribosomal protein S13 [Blattabacterium cuenoti]|uniref:30S ribosomal protein S13 n=1 Tax=Blattabacterium cuenoti TaxID=1653831 RepID=UPI00163BD991|nr:30S ribosomal protein S13 [Blattabacterium cuenoti]